MRPNHLRRVEHLERGSTPAPQTLFDAEEIIVALKTCRYDRRHGDAAFELLAEELRLSVLWHAYRLRHWDEVRPFTAEAMSLVEIVAYYTAFGPQPGPAPEEQEGPVKMPEPSKD